MPEFVPSKFDIRDSIFCGSLFPLPSTFRQVPDTRSAFGGTPETSLQSNPIARSANQIDTLCHTARSGLPNSP
jgi:hypothetical protein